MARFRNSWLRWAALSLLVLQCAGESVAQKFELRLKQSIALANRSNQETTGIPLALPGAVAYDRSGSLYIADVNDHVILKLDTSGILSTVVGTGVQGFAGDGGAATSAQLDSPAGVAVDAGGNLYISDTHNHRIRKVSNGVIETIAGTGMPGFLGDGAAATQAQMNLPGALALDTAGRIYFADTNNHRIRKIDADGSVITTIAGNGEQGYSGDGGAATAARLDSPNGLAVDEAGNVYVSDSHNERVRRIDTLGYITTLAGNGSLGFAGDGASPTSASLARPMGLTVDDKSRVYVADSNNQRIRVIRGGLIDTVVGSGEQGFSGDSGVATSASLNTPLAVAINPAGEVAIADTQNQVVRKTESGTVNTAAGGGPANTLIVQLSGEPSSVYGSGNITATLLNGSSPTGSVTLKEGTAVIGSAALSGGTASFSTASLAAGVHMLVASYAGDAHNTYAVSGLYVLAKIPASLTATANNATRVYGTENPQFTGSVAGVLNQDDITASFGTTATTVSAVGTYPITATLSDPNQRLSNYTVTSTLGTLTISKASSAVTLQTSAAAVLLKNDLVLTATLASSTTGTPTGSVSFREGSTPLGSAPVDSTGTANLPLSTLAAGPHIITAVYSGDTNFTGITSTAQVTVQDFQFSVSGGAATVIPGSAASYSVQLTPTNGATFPGAVTLALAGLPPGATYAITPSQIAAGSGTTAVTVTVHTASLRASSMHPRSGKSGMVALVFGMLPLPGAWRRRRDRAGAAALGLFVLAVFALVSMTACGSGGGFLGQQAQTYTLTLTGTSGALQHSATLNLTVQ